MLFRSIPGLENDWKVLVMVINVLFSIGVTGKGIFVPVEAVNLFSGKIYLTVCWILHLK